LERGADHDPLYRVLMVVVATTENRYFRSWYRRS
jgi:hypothetical protein